jgi:hypothetical protein
VPLNLAISLVTLAFALIVRSRAVSIGALVPYLNEVAGLTVGGVVSAFFGVRFVSANHCFVRPLFAESFLNLQFADRIFRFVCAP